MLWLVPEGGQPMKSVLPLTMASLRDWKRLEPGTARPPLPYAIMMPIVDWLAQQAQGQAALLVWMLLTFPLLHLAFKQAAVAVEAQPRGASLPFRRHGGASLCRLSTVRSRLEVQRQCVWRSASRWQRCEKLGLVAKELGKLEANTLQAAHQASEMS